MSKLGSLFLLCTLIITAPNAFAYRSIHECTSQMTIGYADVNQCGFARSIRQLRAQCSAAAQRYEAAEVVWAGQGIYECRVGLFCNIGG